MSKILNRFLERLTIDRTPTTAESEAAGEIVKGILEPVGDHTEVSENETEVFDECLDSPTNCLNDHTEGERRTLDECSYTWKSARKRPGNRIRGVFEAVLCGVVVATALYTTWIEAETQIQFVFYLVSLAVVSACDPLQIVERVLAKQSRNLFAVVFVLGAVAVYINQSRLWSLTAIVGVVLLLSAVIGNKFWLKAENWEMSETIERALLSNPKSKPAESYQARGKRQTRTLLNQSGIEFHESDLDGKYKSVYYLGYLHADNKANEQKKLIDALRLQVICMQATAEDIGELQQEIQQQDNDISALMELNGRLQATCRELNGRLGDALQYIQEIEQEQEAVPVTEQDKGDLIRSCLLQGMSIRKTAEYVGVKVWKVSEISKAMKQEAMSESEKVVAIGERLAVNE